MVSDRANAIFCWEELGYSIFSAALAFISIDRRGETNNALCSEVISAVHGLSHCSRLTGGIASGCPPVRAMLLS